MAKAKKISAKRIVFWIVAILLFYTFTSARVSTGVFEETKEIEQQTVKEPYVVEKLIKTTKYKTEKVPFGVPRCEQMNYNFSYKYTYTDEIKDGKKIGTCSFLVKNEEDISGTFNFYPQFFKSGRVSEGPNAIKTIDALGTEKFEWNLTVEAIDTLTCLLQIQNPPHRMKCFYLEPITYQIKEVPYTVEELKNVTEYKDVIKTTTALVKQNVTKNIYTNRFFGYKQFLYFGY